MSSLPTLGPRAIRSYNRLAKDIAAFNYVLRIAKPSGPVGRETIATLNGLALMANRLFRHHSDLPRFAGVALDHTMSQADLAIAVARLNAACVHFEERYAHLTAEGVAASARRQAR